jgi:hypothetical protein
MKMQLNRMSLVAVGAMGVGSLAVAGLGVAVAAGHGNTIHGCVAKSDGALRVVHRASSCKSHEKSLSFNIHGPRGPQGPQGPQGSPGDPATSRTIQMYANVDAEGDLGSNVDATGATRISAGEYSVAFNRPIGNCAAIAQAGQAGGTDPILPIPSAVSYDPSNPDQWDLEFVDSPTRTADNTAFMLTVTCPS